MVLPLSDWFSRVTLLNGSYTLASGKIIKFRKYSDTAAVLAAFAN